MSVYQGNAEGFLRYVGPLMRNVVCNLSRPYKKGKSCQGTTAENTKCLKRTGLEAAHINGQTRPAIIVDILEQFIESPDYYKVDLKVFEDEFRKAHEDLDKVIKLMCKPCHTRYDKENHITSVLPITLEDEEGEYREDELEELEKQEIKELKKFIANSQSYKSRILANIQSEYPEINAGNVSYARISEANGMWNFDVNKKKFANDFYFVLFNQQKEETKVVKIPASTLNLADHPSKGDAARFFVKLEDGKLTEKNIKDFSKFII